jgi:hypothetical protein
MSIDFNNEDQMKAASYAKLTQPQQQSSVVSSFLVKRGIVKTESAAKWIAFSVSAVLLVITILLYKKYVFTSREIPERIIELHRELGVPLPVK